MSPQSARPWYREPWPWFLALGPAIVVVAGAVTTTLAITTSDGLVSDDYYKQGLAINRTLAREERASDLQVTARVQFNEERQRVRVWLTAGAVPPKTLRLALFHGARASDDQAIVLGAIAPGLYEGTLRQPGAGKWQLRLEDGEGTWRIVGTWKTQLSGAVLGTAR